jgi:putative restriction endonuclease
VDANFRIHVSAALLNLHDGPMLEHAIKGIDGRQIRMPARMLDWPDRDRLAERFGSFKG